MLEDGSGGQPLRSARRVFDRLEQLYAIGGGPGANGCTRSEAEDEAHRLATTWLEESGLEVEVDASGNLFGHAHGGRGVDKVSDTVSDTCWVGSHLDTVPQGGRFDGALGVVAAIEAVERVGAGSVVAFRGEGGGGIGSRALVARGGPLPRAFLELHVEQGPVLAGVDAPVGVVTGIVRDARGELVFEGRVGHAGTHRWQEGTMRSRPLPRRSYGFGMPPARSRAPSRRSVRSRSSREGAT